MSILLMSEMSSLRYFWQKVIRSASTAAMTRTTPKTHQFLAKAEARKAIPRMIAYEPNVPLRLPPSGM